MESSHSDSLIEADAAAPKQLELVPSTELPAVFLDEVEVSMRGDFTAARLFSQHPDKYRAILSLVAEDFPVRAICRALKVSHNTVKAVCAREGVSLERDRKVLVQDYKVVERLILERMTECVDQMKPEALPMALGIVRDKISTMEGTPTAIVGHLHAQAPIEDINRFIDSLPGVSGTVVESDPSHTGVGAGNVSAIGGGDVPGDDPEPLAEDGARSGEEAAHD